MFKMVSHIDEWIIVENSDGSVMYLVGKITDYGRDRGFKTNIQVTSPIVRMPRLGLVETENTMYVLGKAREDYLNSGIV